jgi:hypothetical protein
MPFAGANPSRRAVLTQDDEVETVGLVPEAHHQEDPRRDERLTAVPQTERAHATAALSRALQQAAGNQALSRHLSPPPVDLSGDSPALDMREQRRMSRAPRGSVQRDIKGSMKLPSGRMAIDFTKNDGVAPGDWATEDGTITFTPAANAPESDSIRFVQIVRTYDTGAGHEADWTGTAEEPRHSQMTTAAKGGVKGGFYVDQEAGSLAQRGKKADPAVQPYYDVTGPPIAGNAIGKRKGATIVPATLEDHPGTGQRWRFEFETEAKGDDNNTWYGSVIWGFEVTHDKKGVAKIKGENRSFKAGHSPTVDAALTKFDEYYKNPGSSTAPKT